MLENRIDRITVRNFRSLKEVSVELDDLTVLVGPNGSGKSNFIDVLSLVRDGLKIGLRDVIALVYSKASYSLHFSGGPRAHPGILDDIEISIYLTLKGRPAEFSFVLHTTNSEAYRLRSETYRVGEDYFSREDNKINSTIKFQPAIQDENFMLPLISGLEAFAPLYEYLSKMQFHSVFMPDIRYLQILNSLMPNEYAKNLHDSIVNLDDKSRVEIGDILGSIVPGISKDNALIVEPYPEPYSEQFFSLRIRHHIGDMHLHQESDGTLRILAFLVALYHRPAPSLMAFEEPEAFIHPPATSYLTELMDEASLRGQIIVSTHSPDFIARFPPESLRVFEMVDGATQISPLREDQMQSIEEGIFDGGDLLRFQGLKRG